MKRFWGFIAVLMIMYGCNVQKHVQTDKVESSNTSLVVNETTDKNTIRYITITKYVTEKDSTTGEYPIESVTEIEERNNDKIVTESKEDKQEKVEEKTVEDKKTEQKFTNYIWAFLIGVGVTLVIVVIIRLLVWYIKRRTGV